MLVCLPFWSWLTDISAGNWCKCSGQVRSRLAKVKRNEIVRRLVELAIHRPVCWMESHLWPRTEGRQVWRRGPWTDRSVPATSSGFLAILASGTSSADCAMLEWWSRWILWSTGWSTKSRPTWPSIQMWTVSLWLMAIDYNCRWQWTYFFAVLAGLVECHSHNS